MSKGRRTGITMNKKLGSTLIAMTIIIFMLFLTLGMFTKTFGGSASAEVASAQTSIVKGELMDVNDDGNGNVDVNENDTGKYAFVVKNTDENGNKRTEVTMKYRIVVITEQGDANNPITVDYELIPATLDSSQNPIEDSDSQMTIAKEKDTDNNDVFTSDDMILNIDDDQTDRYILKFTPESSGDFKFKVKVISEQVD